MAVSIIALLVVWNTRHHGFVWDDRAAIFANRDVRTDDTATPISELFVHDFWGTPIESPRSHKSYRPLTVLSFRLTHLVHGYDSGAFHLYNGLVHVACSVLVLPVARVMAAAAHGQTSPSSMARQQMHASLGSWFAALLFAVHPVHCDAIASIVGRADLLCTLFSLAAFLQYATAVQDSARTRWKPFVSAQALVVAACLSKELGFTTLGLLVIYDILLLLVQWTQRYGHRRVLVARLALIMSFIVVSSIVRVWINGEHGQHEWNVLANSIAVQPERQTRWLSYAHVHAWYLWKLVWPDWLTFDYGFDTIPIITHVDDIRNLYTAAAYAVVLVGIYMAVRRYDRSPLLLSICFGAIPFVPASNLFFPVGTVVAERLLYYPSVGFCCLVGFVIADAACIADRLTRVTVLSSSSPPQKLWSSVITSSVRHIIHLAFALVVVAGACRSYYRNNDWLSEPILFRAALKVTPTNVKVLTNMGKVLLNSDPDEALQYLSVGAALLPKQVEGQTNLGLAHSTKGASLLAIRHLRKSVDSGPLQFQAHGYLGNHLYWHWRQDQWPNSPSLEEMLRSETVRNATAYLDAAINLGSWYPAHFLSRGLMAHQMDQQDFAISCFEASLATLRDLQLRSPDSDLRVDKADVINMLGVTYKEKRDLNKATQVLQDGLVLYPDHLDLNLNMAFIYIDLKDLEQAAAFFDRAVTVAKPHQVGSLVETATILEGMKFYSAALVFAEKAHAMGNTLEVTAPLLERLQRLTTAHA
ncbi:TPA: hypothetical protein N0F65_008742 [Lagenidium giganteum]|uniref:dolichyl-phosphate-mannose--protein mannosyltransferase n=1 Tax=Lagenidium giganteum TaxID=4803 RepID=A0AAV2YY52_9STRA|nr:TPA: hypothetical protein N0F65_008742 [Lagenidium giganteum]